MMENNIRNVAVDLLEKIDAGSYSNLQLNQEIKQGNFIYVDQSLLTEIVYGVLQHKKTIDYYLSPFINNPEKTPSWVMNLLRTAVYQMEYLDRIPEFAIFNETIEIAKRRGSDGIRKLVTGVLRSYQRQGKPSLDLINDRIERLSIEYSVTPWIIDQLCYELGEEKCISILKSINQPSHLSVRINDVSKTRENIIADLKRYYDVKLSLVAEDGLRLSSGPGIDSVESYLDGDITVQDESAMLVAESMQLEPGLKVLDACAAPGGKTTQIAQKVGANGQVDAWDIYENRVSLIQKNANRMGLTNIDTKVHDATAKIESDVQQYERVLVDAPCSGIGLMRRKPEIAFMKSKKDSSDLHKIQLKILNNLAGLVKDGGILTYSTCTILRKENQETIQNFLDEHDEFELIKTQTSKRLKDNRDDQTLTIYPDDYMSDGFFIANLKKVK